MKNFFIIITFLGLVAAPGWSENLTLTHIDITVTGSTDPQVVRNAFLEVREGQTFTREQLDEAVQLAEDRLNATNYYSSVLVTLVVGKKVPGTARIEVEVTDGYPWRFGGGNAFGTFGEANTGGEAKDWTLDLGWNRQDFIWADGNPGWTGGAWSVTAGNEPFVWTDPTGAVWEDHLAGYSAQVTQAGTWGWSVTGFQSTWWDMGPNYSPGILRTDQGAWVTWNRAAPGFSPDRGAWGQGKVSEIFPGGITREEGDLRAYFALGAGWKAAFRVAGGIQEGDYTPKDALAAAGIDALRRTFRSTDLGSARIWSSAELRWAVVQVPFFDFTNLAVEPAVIADFGQGWDAGVALRLYWAVPVDVPLRIEWTIDDQSRIWFGIAVENPF